MADDATLEKRVTSIEFIIAHLPDDLNARFAGVDVKLASIRETQAIHTQRLNTVDRRLTVIENKLDMVLDAVKQLGERG